MGGRLLAWSGRDGTALAASKLATFTRFLTFAVAAEMWESLPYWAAGPHHGWHVTKAIVATLAAIAAWRLPRRATALLGGLLLVEIVAVFPEAANHQYLQLLCLALVAATAPGRPEEPVELLQALRWIGALGLFWAGLQKLLGGYYFTGTFLAYAISRNERFAAFFDWMLPAETIERLRAIPLAPGAGPYRVDETLFVVVSNLTWIGELVLPALLFVPRLRLPALVALIGYIGTIEIAAREIFFGGLIVNLVLLFAPIDAGRRALPFFFALYAWALLSLAGLLPGWVFT